MLSLEFEFLNREKTQRKPENFAFDIDLCPVFKRSNKNHLTPNVFDILFIWVDFLNLGRLFVIWGIKDGTPILTCKISSNHPTAGRFVIGAFAPPSNSLGRNNYFKTETPEILGFLMRFCFFISDSTGKKTNWRLTFDVIHHLILKSNVSLEEDWNFKFKTVILHVTGSVMRLKVFCCWEDEASSVLTSLQPHPLHGTRFQPIRKNPSASRHAGLHVGSQSDCRELTGWDRPGDSLRAPVKTPRSFL